MTWQAWAAIAIFVGAYVLIATERINKTTAAIGGAVGMLLIGAATAETAFFDKSEADTASFEEKTGIEWNVIFLLLGMMLIVAILKRTGVFEYLAIWSAKRAKGRPFAIMVILVVVTAVASAALDNVTTVLLIAPVTFLVCERLNLPVVPFIIAEVMASNIGGTSTLIGDPPNIIIAAQGGLSFNDFLVHMAPLVVLLIAVFVGMCWLLFRRKLRFDPERVASIMVLRERDAIKDPLLLTVALVILAMVLVAFSLHSVLHVEPSVVAMIGGLTIFAAAQIIASPVVTRRRSPKRRTVQLSGEKVFADVEWETLAFFAGLFIMVGSLVHTGVIGTVASAASDAMGDNLLAGSMILLWASAVLSAIVDNIPYVATMAPIVDQLVADAGDTAQSHVLWWALAFGADLGGNATAIGASANVVALGLASRAGHKISFWEFTKYGIIVTLVTIAIVTPYLWLRYFVWD